MGSAQTGTGKTAAFALPILSRLGKHQRGNTARVLILEPTRELAMQVDDAFRDYAKFTDLRAAAFYGGVGYGKQREEIKRGLDVVIATPGRLLDLPGAAGDFTPTAWKFSCWMKWTGCSTWGSCPTCGGSWRSVPPREKRQTLFFSATLPPEIEKLTQWASAAEPGDRRDRRAQESPAETVTSRVLPGEFHAEVRVAKRRCWKRRTTTACFVFARTKHGSDRIAKKLKMDGHRVAVLHGNRSQNQRIEALAGFKSRQVRGDGRH